MLFQIYIILINIYLNIVKRKCASMKIASHKKKSKISVINNWQFLQKQKYEIIIQITLFINLYREGLFFYLCYWNKEIKLQLHIINQPRKYSIFIFLIGHLLQPLHNYEIVMTHF